MQKENTLQKTEVDGQKTIYRILFIISFAHLLNDTVQSLVPAMFPILKDSIGLTYTQIGIIAFALNVVSSIMQPAVGAYTDKKPLPYALPIGLIFTFFGVFGLAVSKSFILLVVSVLLVGIGSATFHPESARVAHLAAGKRRGLAQGIYQVGGNTGQALAPAITALVLVPLGQFGAIWFMIIAAGAVFLLFYIAKWYNEQIHLGLKNKKSTAEAKDNNKKHRKKVITAMVILVFFVFARTWFYSGITNFYAFFAIEQYNVSIQGAQLYLFLFLLAGAAGTFLGGPLADRFGKKIVIVSSMLLPIPFTLALPYAGKMIAYPLITLIGFITLCSFSVAVVYAQEIMPGRIGMVSGLIMGLGFGIGAIGSIVFGILADIIGMTNTMIVVGFLPFIGLVTLLLPNDRWIRTNIK